MMDSQTAAISSVAVLIEAVGRGSQIALKRLYELESRRLHGIALRIVRRPEIAADVLQEAFVQIWQNAAAFSAERGAGAAWLTGIVRYRALDAIRRLGREIPSDDPALGDEAIEPDVIEKMGASAEAEALRRCLKLLDGDQQRCIVLAFVDGLSHSQIAERIKAPLGSVKKLDPARIILAAKMSRTMIPEDSEELHVLAGEYVLGVLDADEAEEVAAALASNAELRRAVARWEEQLHPLSSLATSADPPAGSWQAIEARIGAPAPKPVAPRFWDSIALWPWSTAGFAAAAAALALWIAITPVPGPSFVAVLHSPQQDQASWVATAGRNNLLVRAVTAETPPRDRAFELWAIAPGATRPRSLGVIPPDGLRLSPLPSDLRDGATLAISVEPVGGSPTQQPTGPVVFVGSVKAI